MKIAMMGQKVVPSREGGVEVVVDNLATRMAALGHEVTLYNRKRKHFKGEKPLKEYKGCHIKEVFTVDNKKLDAIVYSFFATLKCRFGHYDVVHVHAEGPCYFLWLLGKKKHRKFRLIVTIHGLDWQRSKWGGFATRVIQRGERNAVKYADEIIVLSRNVERYFRKTYHRTVTYIPNGVNPPNLQEPDIIKKQFGLEKNGYILFLARIVPEKGLHYLVEAWKKVKQQIQTDKKLVIAGGDSHSADYYKKIQEMVKGDDSIIMTGFVQGELLEELYSNAYLYVLPSDIEGMPISLLEAKSYGNVCLVSDIPENREIISSDDYVFEAGNVDRLRHQIKKIIRLNIQTHENILLPFDWDKVTQKTLDLYEGEDWSIQS